jgi:hypothetical protein
MLKRVLRSLPTAVEQPDEVIDSITDEFEARLVLLNESNVGKSNANRDGELSFCFMFSPVIFGSLVQGDFADQAKNNEFTKIVDNYALTFTKALYKAGISPDIDDESMKVIVKSLLDIAFSFRDGL